MQTSSLHRQFLDRTLNTEWELINISIHGGVITTNWTCMLKAKGWTISRAFVFWKKSLLSIPQKAIFTLLALISWISSSIFRRNSRFASNISCTASSRSAEESWAFRRYVKNKNHIGMRIKFLNDSYYPLTSRSLSIRISSSSFCFSSCVSSSNSSFCSSEASLCIRSFRFFSFHFYEWIGTLHARKRYTQYGLMILINSQGYVSIK